MVNLPFPAQAAALVLHSAWSYTRQAVPVQAGALRRGQQAQTAAASSGAAALTFQSAGLPSQQWYFKQRRREQESL